MSVVDGCGERNEDVGNVEFVASTVVCVGGQEVHVVIVVVVEVLI